MFLVKYLHPHHQFLRFSYRNCIFLRYYRNRTAVKKCDISEGVIQTTSNELQGVFYWFPGIFVGWLMIADILEKLLYKGKLSHK